MQASPASVSAADPGGRPTMTVPEYNRTGVDYRDPMPPPPVRGRVIDGHCHLLAARHARVWFDTADHFGLWSFVTQTPLEEALALHRRWGHRLHYVAVPAWQKMAPTPAATDEWLRRIDAFYNLGARIAKLHLAPGTMQRTGLRLDQPGIRRVLRELRDRRMMIMTHIGDPDLWYQKRFAADPFLGNRPEQYRLWEEALEAFRGTPWLSAHLGGNPENLPYLQTLLDRFPDVVMDLSATRWMIRELSRQRDATREFLIRYQDRIIWGSDQVSGDARGFDFLASRWWCHRKLFETAIRQPSPILDPDLPEDGQPILHGSALPDAVLQKLYRDNAVRMLAGLGINAVD